MRFTSWIAFALAAGAGLAAPVQRPNFLLIVVDDQSPFDFRFYDTASRLRAPAIERLAAEGVVFETAVHMGSFSAAVCTPSRYMIMTGRSLWHLPISPTPIPRCPSGIETNTMAAVFRRAGYVTMHTSKVGNSYKGANRQFEVRRDATKRGPGEEDGSAWHANQVLAFLREWGTAGDARPFFIHLGFSHPHDPRDAPQVLLRRYGAVNVKNPAEVSEASAATPPLPLNWLPRHPFPHGHEDVRDEVAVPGVGTDRSPRVIRNELGRQYACVENIDRQIARVRERLEQMGEWTRTYVIYTADNGISIGRHGLMGKQTLYEHAWRVPFVVRGPGVPAGVRVRGNIYLSDVLPTLCDLAGIPPPPTVEGQSFRAVLEGRRAALREVLYGAYCGGAKPGIRCVREGDWKLIAYHNGTATGRRVQLFNLRDNPWELLPEHRAPEVVAALGRCPAAAETDLAGDPRFASQLARMQALLLSEMRRLDDPWRLWFEPNEGRVAPTDKARPDGPPSTL
ncbi:MAG: sulfatase-like hydrolase/transferase [Kiritimatiellae bacterium]|nr:sulfatase-like hydrolase/transferase [Kiritimatiellia bacterium]